MFLEKKGLKKLLLLQALIGGGSPAVERIALGNPLTFGTDLAKPLVSLEIPFTPQQEGTGDPSPSNIRSIIPWNGLTVFGGGKNLLNPAKRDNSYNNNIYFYRGEGLLLSAGTYTMSKTGENSSMFVQRPDGTTIANNTNKQSFTFTLTESETVVINYYKSGGINHEVDCQLEVGFSATAYEPYKHITETDIVFPSPVYGGEHEAVSGKLMDGWAVKVFDGSPDELWDKISSGSASAFAMQIQISGKSASADSYMCDSLKNIARTATWGNYDNWISDNQNSIVTGIKAITTVADWRAYLAEHPITVAYKLATPQEITLTPQQITALVGDNTIWSDADGSMTCVYLVSSKYADEHPVGGLGFGFGFGSGSDPDEPDDPENPDEPEEPIIDDSENNQTEGEEP